MSHNNVNGLRTDPRSFNHRYIHYGGGSAHEAFSRTAEYETFNRPRQWPERFDSHPAVLDGGSQNARDLEGVRGSIPLEML